ncbi:uncharacterized protein N7479_009999 [Penicillium vulpinum]|uniref:Cytochrome P450 monooxygenase n=1 Tax=Penicillium vulpinum TaxID=29845 RepID=A0A1V6RF39_9EURO|nr:uncharacterized protein N7479_009999 [Penicillium vulpinum]KAJ5951586.1 hypothetical protein N7479_009999 [Penicillium vulpinum]OQE00013.1 hypothetical protein PENVUL_c060G06629 [Penicillium vulpinum]
MLGYLINGLPPADAVVAVGVILLTGYVLQLAFAVGSKLPLINQNSILDLGSMKSRRSYVTGAADLIKSGFSQSAKGFRLITDNGCQVVLPPKYLNEIRNHPDMSRDKASAKELHSHLPGFEPFREGSKDERIMHDVVLTKLTRTLGRVTEHLSKETAMAVQKHWTDEKEWHAISLRTTITPMLAQMSSRVFLGELLCRDPNWLHITINYAIHVIRATEKLRQWPKILRPFANQVLPSCRMIRSDMKQALDLITPILTKRRAEKAAAIKAGKVPTEHNDAIDWMEDVAKGRPYNPAISQLLLSMAAIHTSADMLTQILFDIAAQPDLIKALREEIITVTRDNGWNKISLYKLVLMDSTIKESQRLKPVAITPMRRLTTTDVELSDGVFIPKDTTILISADSMWDEKNYENPQQFDGYRFLKMRDIPGQQTAAQLVAPSPIHLGWGFGQHACPGRFFAANEMKIALCQILLKYDIKLDETCLPQVRRFGVSMAADSTANLVIRRRQEEVSPEALGCQV